jgi:hypothetical protein
MAPRQADSREYLNVLWLVLQHMKKDTANYGYDTMQEARRTLNAFIDASNDHDLINGGIIDDDNVYAIPLKLAGEVFDLAYRGWDTMVTVKRILRNPQKQFHWKGRVNWSPDTLFVESKPKTRPPRQHRSGFKFHKYV